MINKQKDTLTKKQTFKIGVQKFMEHIPFNQDKIRDSFIFVDATDEVNAIQEYNEVYDNYKDVHTYLILGNGKMTNAIKK
jgi:hypothetical protein